MKYEVRLTGSGGQGVILASVILGAAAALYEDKYAIQSQAYGPEARGGATKSDVVISDGPIMYPKAKNIDYLLCLTQKAGEKFIKTAKKGALVVIDSDFVSLPDSPDYNLYKLPLTTMTMEKLGKLVALNIVSLAAIVEISGVVSRESLKKAVMDKIPKGTEEFNMKALEVGFEIGAQAKR